jgi:hypothetical protein
MSFSNDDVHNWAQSALDRYNGSYSTTDILLNATVYLYGLRDNGNADPALAAASHYLHCRYVGAQAYVVGAIVGFVAVLAYDVIWKLIEKFSSSDLSYHFGQGPPSAFDPLMIAWDMQGLSDGVSDSLFSWGKPTLTAPYYPQNNFYPDTL